MFELDTKSQEIYDYLINQINIFVRDKKMQEKIIFLIDDLIDNCCKFNLCVEKILAVGSNKRFMWVRYGPLMTFCIRISDHLYCVLKSAGVPT